jgi:ABC-type branched-subunit amino acid transport system substrate-binding protein
MRPKTAKAEFERVNELALDLATDLHRIDENVRNHLGWSDDVTTPLAYARQFAALAAYAASLSQAMLIKLAMDEDREALRKTLTNANPET